MDGPRRARLGAARAQVRPAPRRARPRDDGHDGQPLRRRAAAPAGAVLGPVARRLPQARRRDDARGPLRQRGGRQARALAARRAVPPPGGAGRLAHRHAQVRARRRGDARAHGRGAGALPPQGAGMASQAACVDGAGDVRGAPREPQAHLHRPDLLPQLARRALPLLRRLPRLRRARPHRLPALPRAAPRADERVRGARHVVSPPAEAARPPRGRAFRPSARRGARAPRAGAREADGEDRAAARHAGGGRDAHRGDRRALQVAPHAPRARRRRVLRLHRDAVHLPHGRDLLRDGRGVHARVRRPAHGASRRDVRGRTPRVPPRRGLPQRGAALEPARAHEQGRARGVRERVRAAHGPRRRRRAGDRAGKHARDRLQVQLQPRGGLARGEAPLADGPQLRQLRDRPRAGVRRAWRGPRAVPAPAPQLPREGQPLRLLHPHALRGRAACGHPGRPLPDGRRVRRRGGGRTRRWSAPSRSSWATRPRRTSR